MSEFYSEYYKLFNNEFASLRKMEEEESSKSAWDLIHRGATVGQLDLFGDIWIAPLKLNEYSGKTYSFVTEREFIHEVFVQ